VSQQPVPKGCFHPLHTQTPNTLKESKKNRDRENGTAGKREEQERHVKRDMCVKKRVSISGSSSCRS